MLCGACLVVINELLCNATHCPPARKEKQDGHSLGIGRAWQATTHLPDQEYGHTLEHRVRQDASILTLQTDSSQTFRGEALLALEPTWNLAKGVMSSAPLGLTAKLSNALDWLTP